MTSQSSPDGKSFAFDEPPGFGLDEALARCEAAGFSSWKTSAGPLRNAEEVRRAVAEGATRFIIDPSEYAAPRAGAFTSEELAAAQAALVEDGVFAAENWANEYLADEFAMGGALRLRFTPEALARTAVKYGWAVAFAAEIAVGLAGWIEIRFDEALRPATALEHFFVARELRRRGVAFAALALRLPGTFEPAVEFEGDLEELDQALAAHVAVARGTGSHRIGVLHAEGKLAALPVIGRICGDLLHLHASGLGWLAALRATARTEPMRFREILLCAQEHFVFDAHGHHLSITEEEVRFLPEVPDADLERTFLDDPRGRQLLHMTARSILAGPFRAPPPALHRELFLASVAQHLDSLRGDVPKPPAH